MTSGEATGADPLAMRPAEAPPRILTSAELLRDSREVVILHRQERYRLRLTRTGKLILTK